ncbi:hypothetical protein MtrunA17_Chr4g0005951 [Medicago truncatula]|uniref:Transmembrane protein n=1 Tax=Medicago truncatula TaxID=3880 RepID=A0A396HZJ3_MEDTR|nr:hypothetical protein MtrunA17_Chr4g0005951 [Medicago truncatula]
MSSLYFFSLLSTFFFSFTLLFSVPLLRNSNNNITKKTPKIKSLSHKLNSTKAFRFWFLILDPKLKLYLESKIKN